jgi:hypothetical protein
VNIRDTGAVKNFEKDDFSNRIFEINKRQDLADARSGSVDASICAFPDVVLNDDNLLVSYVRLHVSKRNTYNAVD